MLLEIFLKELNIPSLKRIYEDEETKEIEVTSIFPTDEEIETVAKKADEAFWRVVVDEFKDRVVTKKIDINKELKQEQILAIKTWLKKNWPEN